jgi:hypothetical protein
VSHSVNIGEDCARIEVLCRYDAFTVNELAPVIVFFQSYQKLLS